MFRYRIRGIALFLALFLMVGCTAPGRVSDGQEDNYHKNKEELFKRFRNNDGALVDALIEELIGYVESEDVTAIKELFSVNTVRTSQDLDGEILAMVALLEGDMVSFQRHGPGTFTSKEGGAYREEIEATFDLSMTSGQYRLALKLCTIDTDEPNHVGLCSVYIIPSEKSDMTRAYWPPNEMWIPGIQIEE